MEDNKLELFFDVLEKTIEILYEETHKSYFDLYFETVNNILAGEVLGDYDEEVTQKLLRLYSKLSDVDFTPEDIRKALQAIIIRGFKETNSVNDVTPDTIGFLVAYLISRFNKDAKKVSILDPICGCGNLLFSVENHLNFECELYAIDHSDLKIKLCQSMANLMNTNVELYLQDTLNIKMKDMDFLIFDTPNDNFDKTYFPYDLVLNHKESLKDNGIMIGIVPNDFFMYDNEGSFKNELMQDTMVYGIIELPDDFFISQPKSIVIFKKCPKTDKKCMMIKLPSFDDVKLFNSALTEIEAWFEKN
ncbi:MAG: class I SAM-dependent methyltransferase [Anaeroplasmataceae bacterium]